MYNAISIERQFTITSSQEHSIVTTPYKGGALPLILGTAISIFVVDQLLKFWVVRTIPVWNSWSLFHGFSHIFRFTFVTNTGTAFGMFPQLGNLFMIVAVVVIIGIIVFHHYLPVDKGRVRLGLGLMLGGALGNLTDRLTRGYVVDFIDIAFLPIFNIADAAIVMGMAFLSYAFWQEERIARQARAQ